MDGVSEETNTALFVSLFCKNLGKLRTEVGSASASEQNGYVKLCLLSGRLRNRAYIRGTYSVGPGAGVDL
jgi:hypothetical protein